MRNRILASLISAAVCLTATWMFAKDEPKKDELKKEEPKKELSELQVLQNYVGKWDINVSAGNSSILTGDASAEWILDGKFVQQTASLRPKEGSAGIKFTTLMTYDAEKKAYRSWTFLSNGGVSQSDGVWDSKSKTITWVGQKDDRGNISTTKADFSQPDLEKVNIVIADPGGKTITEMTAKNTRRK